MERRLAALHGLARRGAQPTRLRTGACLVARASACACFPGNPVRPTRAPHSIRARWQAAEAGRTLLDHGVCDLKQVYVSTLKRTVKTAWVLLEAMDTFTVPVVQRWQLNERMYGALTGLDKAEAQRVLGRSGFEQLRREPPPLDSESCFAPNRNRAFSSVPTEALPAKESFRDTRDRVLPFWRDELVLRAEVRQRHAGAPSTPASSTAHSRRSLSLACANRGPSPTGVPIRRARGRRETTCWSSRRM